MFQNKLDFITMWDQNQIETPASLMFTQKQCPAGRVFQYRVRSGWVLGKIPGSGSGSGRVGVSKNMIGYFRVSFFLSGILGISGYVGYFQVFKGLPIYTRVIF